MKLHLYTTLFTILLAALTAVASPVPCAGCVLPSDKMKGMASKSDPPSLSSPFASPSSPLPSEAPSTSGGGVRGYADLPAVSTTSFAAATPSALPTTASSVYHSPEASKPQPDCPGCVI